MTGKNCVNGQRHSKNAHCGWQKILFALKKPSNYVLLLGCTKAEQLHLLYKRQSESNASIFHFTQFTSWTHENFWELHYTTAKGRVIFQYILQICQQSSSIFEQKYLFFPSKSSSLSYADTGTQYSAVPLHWHYSVLAGFLRKTT